jgi:hypothetical protein
MQHPIEINMLIIIDHRDPQLYSVIVYINSNAASSLATKSLISAIQPVPGPTHLLSYRTIGKRVRRCCFVVYLKNNGT